MSRLYYSVIVLLLLIGTFTGFTFAIKPSDSVSAILESYANNPFLSSPEENHYIPKTLTSNFSNFVANDYSTTEPFKISIQNKDTYTNDELKAADSQRVETKANNYSSSSEEVSDEDPKGPPDHQIPYSEHEDPEEPSTRPNYTEPGGWAKPPPDKDIPLDFVPTKMYAQVRGTHTIKHVPREEAAKSAETDEEKENAARLKEVVKVTKANTIYTEEGYEDAAYDHAGQIRDANFHEGYAKKLNENRDKQTGKRRPKILNFKEYQSTESENFDDDYRDHESEVAEEARTFHQNVEPENVGDLRSALNKSVIHPKSLAEEGILRLADDLKKEDDAAKTTSTELYSTTNLAASTTSIAQSVPNQTDYETTTLKSNVFTVRPRKLITVKPHVYSAKIKIPNRYNPISKRNDEYTIFPLDHKDTTTTIDYDHSWQPVYKERHPTSTVTYRPSTTELQSNSPVVTKPLALATVNGHGPYLVEVKNPTSTYVPVASEETNADTTLSDVGFLESTYKSSLPYYTTPKYKIINRHTSPKYYDVSNDYNTVPTRDDDEITDRSYKYIKVKSRPDKPRISDNASIRKPPENYFDYLTIMQPPKTSNSYIINPQYKKTFHDNPWEPRIMHVNNQISRNPYKMINAAESSRSDLALLNVEPETILVPPAPLSTSEYTSFVMHDKKNDPAISTVMSIMPIIKAIQKQENKLASSLFFFRKKRSAAGFYKKLSDSDTSKGQNQRFGESNKIERVERGKVNDSQVNKKFPDKFKFLLNQSPNVANRVVNQEIKNRFKNSENSSKTKNKVTHDNSNEKSSEDSRENGGKNSDEIKNEHKNNTVQVEVPEVDFSDVFEEDQVITTTKKPSIKINKYPYYKNAEMENTALKYVVNPMKVPRKTLGGMEFYKSRDLECDESDPNLDNIVPEDKDLEKKIGPRKKKPRLHGLGEKLDCYKAKYFGKNPLDNPLFSEKSVKMPAMPSELNPVKFTSRILKLPTENSEYIVQKSSKTPEKQDPIKYAASKNIPRVRVPYKKNNQRPKKPNTKQIDDQKNENSTLYKNIKLNKTVYKLRHKPINLRVSPSFQRHVYEDVMGTIQNLENNYKSPVPKKYSSSNSYGNSFQNPKRKKNNKIKKSKNPHQVIISGLVPPPEPSANLIAYRNKQIKYNNPRNYPRQLNQVTVINSRIVKRNININKTIEAENSDDQVNRTLDGLSKKVNLTMIFPTPIPSSLQKKIKDFAMPSNKTTNQTTSLKSNNDTKYPDRHSEDVGKYGKFTERKNYQQSTDLRRKEPRYNDSHKRKETNETVPNFIKAKPSKNNSKSKVDLKISDSTLIPVVVKYDEQSIKRIPQESKIESTKLKLKNSNLKEKSSLLKNKENRKENDSKYPKNQYSSDKNNDDKYTTDNSKELNNDNHTSLKEFLKGDPPGYAEAFGGESFFPDKNETQDSKPGETTQNEELEDDRSSEEENQSREKTKNKEASEDESSSEDVEAEKQEQTESKEDSASSSGESGGNSFERYSDRPDSPPENYYDGRYADLGPRVNKPYFYHPPFETDEKRKLKKTSGNYDDDEDDDEYAHSEETKNHDKLIFPWEKDENSSEEVEYSSKLGRYEYPWERRERKSKERRKRDRLKKKYGELYRYHLDDDDGDDDNGDGESYGEATNTKPSYYIPLEKRRGKKDVSKVDANVRNISSKFSSKYKTENPESLVENKKVLSVNDSNKTERSTGNNLKSETLASETLKDLIDVTDSVLPKNKNKTNLITKIFQATALPIDTTNATDHPLRTRIRKYNILKPRIGNNSEIKSVEENKTQISSTPISIQRRGRQRYNFRIATTTLSSLPPIESQKRRRNLLITTPASPIVSADTTPIANRYRRLTQPNKTVTVRNSRRTRLNGETTSPSASTSTEKTIEHHSRISRKQTITKTFYHNEDDDDDAEDKSSDASKQPAGGTAKNKRINRRRKSTKYPESKHGVQKEKVEKITITMEETPDHVYKTKEIDRDGVKGKFVTIIANNNTNALENRTDEFGIDDEDLKNFKSNNNADQAVADLADEPSGIQAIENHALKKPNNLSLLANDKATTGSRVDSNLLVGSLRKPNNTDGKIDTKNKTYNPNDDIDEDDDESGADSREIDNDGDDSRESSNEDNSNEESVSYEDSKSIAEKSDEKNLTAKSLPKIIKDPNKRLYYYVE